MVKFFVKKKKTQPTIKTNSKTATFMNIRGWIFINATVSLLVLVGDHTFSKFQAKLNSLFIRITVWGLYTNSTVISSCLSAFHLQGMRSALIKIKICIHSKKKIQFHDDKIHPGGLFNTETQN